MTRCCARAQADNYARAVSRDDGWPPFLLVVDVGHVLEVYADFSGQGQGYTQFPDGNRYRITLDDLRDEATRERLRLIWTDPHALDPSKVSARVTREVADRLAALGRSFEGQGHPPEAVARFLMRCLFTMFAEDVDLIPHGSLSDMLKKLRGHPERAAPALTKLWQVMNEGGFSGVLMQDVLRFNGGLFRESDALPLSEMQLSLLIDAAEKDWREVEPAIFGTLLERALDKRQRHKLGAHYTPRAYVERLVVPTIMDPLRNDWRDVQAAAMTLANQGKLKEARDIVHAFHAQLCEIRVLDPACGSGNFLYVALELMKRLEGEVTALLGELGEEQAALSLAGHTVDPHQFLGLELNPCGGGGRAGAVDWLSAMAFPHPRPGHPVATRAARFSQYRKPRRGADHSGHATKAGRIRRTRHPLGWLFHHHPPCHRRGCARPRRPRGGAGLRQTHPR